MRYVLWWLIGISLVLVAAGNPGIVFANMANPYMAGDPVGEPAGDLKQIAITRETLDIDLRPLEKDNRAVVTAMYQVRNDGPAEHVDLLFVPVALDSRQTGAAGVWLDGQKVSSRISAAQPLPASWQPPQTTPGLDGQPALRYRIIHGGGEGITFALRLTSGTHRIRVRYLARASQVSGNSPVRYWQLGYVLAPARNWKNFGQLDVTVEVPSRWQLASSLPLQREGDMLRGTFHGVPADALGLTAQAPVPPQAPVADLAPFVFGIGLIVVAIIGWLTGMLVALRRWSSLMALPVAMLAALALATAVIGSSVAVRPESVIPSSQVAWDYGYGQDRLQGFATIALALFSLPAGFSVTQLAAVLAHRHQSKRLSR